MHRDLKISVVIPCYNEEEGVQLVIRSLPECVDEVVVVDNNSTDRTAEVATSLGARVVKETRKGYGAAYKAGLPAVTGDITITMDGDGTYPSEQIGELVPKVKDAGVEDGRCSQRLEDLENRYRSWQVAWEEFSVKAADNERDAEVQASRVEHLEQLLQRFRE